MGLGRTQGVRLGHHAQELLHLGAPQVGEVRHLHLTCEEGALDLEAEHHVHAVRQLIRVDSDEPGARLLGFQVLGFHVLGFRVYGLWFRV